jgi:hypothetical protein
MGESVWLFLHMLDRADWESGKVTEWKDEAEAEEMGMPVRTLREHRRKLEELEYISCAQKQYGQEITIHNWTNPREYSGTVTNKKQGYKELPPQEDGQGYIQGDTQGYIQGDRKDVTPTSNSNIKESYGAEAPKATYKTDELPIEWQVAAGAKTITPPDQDHARRVDFSNLVAVGTSNPPAFAAIAMAFQTARNITLPHDKAKGQRKAIKEMVEMGVKPEHIKQAVSQLMDKRMTVTDLYSVSKTAIDLANKPQEKIEYTRQLYEG